MSKNQLVRRKIESPDIGVVEGLVYKSYNGFYIIEGILYVAYVKQSEDLRGYQVVERHKPLVLAREVWRDLDAVVIDMIAYLLDSSALHFLLFEVLNCKDRGSLELDLGKFERGEFNE